MSMIYLFIGLIVGIIMGLTGAGGALISIPLFLTFLNVGLKEATVLSLLAVLMGTGTNLIGSLKKVDKKIVVAFATFGALANIISLGLKSKTPDIMIGLILSIIGVYSIWSIWQREVKTSGDNGQKISFLKLIATGLFLGVMTTLTGLGGGVLLMPLLVKFFGKTYSSALPTSLATIFLISLTSFIMQGEQALKLITVKEIGFISLGALLSFYCLKLFLKRMNVDKVTLIRKVVFTIVTLYSVVSIILRSIS